MIPFTIALKRIKYMIINLVKEAKYLFKDTDERNQGDRNRWRNT